MSAAALSRDRIVAGPGWSRWLVPPAALSIHLAIGSVYSWSVFKLPLHESLGASGLLSAMPFTLGIVMLGASAAVFGTAVDRRGPRWAMFVALSCFCGGLLVAAAAAEMGQMWLIIVGYGVIGGVGLGIGYISPVSTLMKWFPDRPGMATGFAIMGFGGGALIASPWSSQLMKWFGADRHGLAATFLVMGLVYAVFMSVGVLLIRVPPHEWDPPIVRVASSKLPHAAGPDRTANEAIRMPQFWLLWIVLCFNVTAGIGILERAAPIYRDYFPRAASPAALTAAAAGFVAILSLANSLGRILWSSASDGAGRKNMYRLYLGLGAVLYVVLIVAQNASKPLFLVVCILLLSFYGAGFSTAPAYLRDLFGYLEVGAIHGRLLTAWSTAGVLGPVIVNAIADNRIAAHVAGPERYRWSFMIMVILLLIGVVCNELIRTPRPPSFVVAGMDTRKPASVISGEGGR
ncbi:OFA family MFS transporter [Mycobacterium montefiorense]|uniref:OFA family MFS transporter n=1 Tax=Mycobacterium montefiorense TaxID=154654 RepID=UPI0021F349F6|nr:OFA family MFS transporter [Mycobacterium montefiorense]MCV7427471.1 OFA family MFS transporter [Mycobacterium montefiorense]